MYTIQTLFNLIGDVIVSMLASSVVDRGFKPLSVKPKTQILLFNFFLLQIQTWIDISIILYSLYDLYK
jgi:hypothetical protein